MTFESGATTDYLVPSPVYLKKRRPPLGLTSKILPNPPETNFMVSSPYYCIQALKEALVTSTSGIPIDRHSPTESRIEIETAPLQTSLRGAYLSALLVNGSITDNRRADCDHATQRAVAG
jgi:hypothetical protein